MAKRIVTISYTSLTASGGVPKFNRDIRAAFPDRQHIHFCWADYPWAPQVDSRGETEWGRARILNEYLVASRMISSEDVVIADGFWATGLEHLPLAVSHSHGIWSHLTKEDVDAGKPPDMPMHHAAQVAFRNRWITSLGKHVTAVSDFIADQMFLQWGFQVDRVINNGVDTEIYKPTGISHGSEHPLIIHGVNDVSNVNKGGDHIQLLKQHFPNVYSLDEVAAMFPLLTKAQALSMADLFVHPSGYEGNSMMVAEALACGLPFVGYDVGYAYTMARTLDADHRVGAILPRTARCPQYTYMWCDAVLKSIEWDSPHEAYLLRSNARSVAVTDLSIERFNVEWRDYIAKIEAQHA